VKKKFYFMWLIHASIRLPHHPHLQDSHHRHGSGDGAKCGAKFATTSCITIGKATSASQMRKELGLESRQTKGHDLVKYFWQDNSPGGKDFPSVRIHLKSACPADDRNVAVE
jgi:hypothetical protein